MILLIISSGALYGQDLSKSPHINIVYSSIMNRGLAYGINLEEIKLIKYGYKVTLKEIIIVEQIPNKKENTIGLTKWIPNKKGYYAYIYIKETILQDLFVLEETLAHELGHLWGLGHTCMFCNTIMKEYFIIPKEDSDRYYDRYLHEYKSTIKWNNFFNELKEKHEI